MKQILLLEDLPEIRAWLKALALQVFPDAQISEASRIHDALELVNAVRFDVAMLDLGLPDGSGVEVVQALREKQPEAQSVVVTIHEGDSKGQTFGQVSNAFIRLVDANNNNEVVRYDLSEDASMNAAMVFVELYRGNEGDIKVKAIGEGWRSGLAGLAGAMGVNIG